MSVPIVIPIEITPAEREYLQELVAGGLFGRTIEEAAERLVAQGLEQKLRNRLVDQIDTQAQASRPRS